MKILTTLSRPIRHTAGFSLIEVIIVIAIIGFLSAMLFPNFAKIQTKAKEASLQAAVHALQSSVESYSMDAGTYPAGTNLTVPQLIDILKTTGALTKVPKNPFTGHTYTGSDAAGKIMYDYDAQTNHYSLQGFGENNENLVIKLENI